MKDQNENIEENKDNSFDEVQDVSSEQDAFEDVVFVESTEDGDVLPTKDIVKKLREENKKLRSEKDEYLTGWQRAKADYVNLQKELNEVRLNSLNIGKEKTINGILPVIDSFDMAFSNKEAWEKVDSNWRTGIEYIYQQFTKSLEDLNVFKINDLNIDFNPLMHEPVDTTDTTDSNLENKIAEVVQAGYIIKGANTQEKIIRPAKVRVYKLA